MDLFFYLNILYNKVLIIFFKWSLIGPQTHISYWGVFSLQWWSISDRNPERNRQKGHKVWRIYALTVDRKCLPLELLIVCYLVSYFEKEPGVSIRPLMDKIRNKIWDDSRSHLFHSGSGSYTSNCRVKLITRVFLYCLFSGNLFLLMINAKTQLISFK